VIRRDLRANANMRRVASAALSSSNPSERRENTTPAVSVIQSRPRVCRSSQRVFDFRHECLRLTST
jgi:hypothetical protein